ncbi:MAG: site-specific DNA-methyltransferase [Chloroflexi bacterium]|nr:site-specific DNA-methyltransferase [Chloroflexota bacterium]
MTDAKSNREPVTKETPDLLGEQIESLRQIFPEAFAEGKLDFDKLRAALGDFVDERPERYSFTWAGKRDAIRLLQTPSRATLIPAPAEGVNVTTTQNLFIEGDNLEVLKLLYKAYFGRVKMIYIDPPYNTGNDFVYPDDYADPLKTYLELTQQITSNPETSGRYHSAWLSMMYPRLFLARQLLREDGVIFVSIDDHEVHNLRMAMNEIFGEENFYGSIVWQKKDTPSNDVQGISITHEYILAYVKSSAFTRHLLARTEEQLGIYKNPDNDPRGVWTRNALTRKEFVERDYYAIKNPQGREVYPPPGTSWRVSRKTLERLIAEDRIWWGKDRDGDMPFVKRFLSEVQQGVVPTSWWDYEFAGSNRNAKMEIRSLFDNEAPFETPKPSKLLSRLLTISTTNDDLILDFFAGSCTTAQAVLELNREDGGNRRFIMAQLPEPIATPVTLSVNGAKRSEREASRKSLQGDSSPSAQNDKPMETIADIGKERIRRVIAKMQKENAGKMNLQDRATPEDLGFKVFKLAPSNYKQWCFVGANENSPKPTPAEYATQVAMFAEPLADGWQLENVIYEVAVKEGYGLNCRIEFAETSGVPIPAHGDDLFQRNAIYRVTDLDKEQSFYICLADKLRLEACKPLPLTRTILFICRDTALDDKAAANLALQCRLKTI